MKNLVIVESPAKAKTLEKYLGKDYKVTSSYGHIRDLPKKKMGVEIDKDFEPNYVIPDKKKKHVRELKKQAKQADTIWLATDDDREGEAIAWHLKKALDLKDEDTKRIVFHEITKPAVLSAIEHPKDIDYNLVDAQQARRVLDRLVGYELSPVLWRKVRPGLSAGRVQSVAVRLLVEREREIEEFNSESYYKIKATFDSKDQEFEAEIPKKLKERDEAKDLLESCLGKNFEIKDIQKKPGKKRSSPPFTTSTLQQTAHSRLGFSVKQTMTLAQRLYEAGKITYMRTDSMNMSKIAQDQATKLIKEKYGPEYSDPTNYKTKSSGAQEAHEAIRPTNFSTEKASSDRNQQRLYELIRQRALASQMSAAKVEKTNLTIGADGVARDFVAKGEIITFDGFLRVYTFKRKEDKILPDFKVGDAASLLEAIATQSYSRPPARYTEASLVKKLEEMGIGRPSTYAPTISTIMSRGYVEKPQLQGHEREYEVIKLEGDKISSHNETETTGADKNKLVPTDSGVVVTDFLVKYFKDIVDYDFTANVEDEFDEISSGDKPWNKMIADFYKDFHKTIEDSSNISREEATQAREVGTDPESGKVIIARYGRYGPMLQLGHADSEEKPKFASIPEDKKIDTITLDEALEMFQLPKYIGTTEDGEEIVSNYGRYGPYIKYGKNYVSIKPETPFTITKETAIKLIAEKEKKEADKYIQRFEEEGIDVINGRYGPYVTDGKKNAKIPKDKEPSELSLEECKEILKNKKNRKGKRKKTKKAKKSKKTKKQ